MAIRASVVSFFCHRVRFSFDPMRDGPRFGMLSCSSEPALLSAMCTQHSMPVHMGQEYYRYVLAICIENR